MNKKIAFLRGINVGGHKKILMADLRQLFQDLGFEQIKTHIQSGNVIFVSDDKLRIEEIERSLEVAILEKFGFEVPVIVRTVQELGDLVKKNPFLEAGVENINQLLFTFLKDIPKKENVKKLLTYNFDPDRFVIEDKNIYLFCDGQFHKSKMSIQFFEKNLKVAASTRAWKTVVKLVAMAS